MRWASTRRMPPLISLPRAMPPWPSAKSLSSMRMFWQGAPASRPSRSGPPGHPLHRHAPAQHRVELPHGAVVEGEALEQHPLTADELDEVGPQEVAGSEAPRLHRHPLQVHPPQGRPVGLLEVGLVGGPGLLHLVVPVPPVGTVRPAVQGPGAGDGDIPGVPGVEQGAEIPAGAGLPVGIHHGVVFRQVPGDELYPGVRAVQPQLHPAFQPQRPGAVHPRREHQPPAPLGGQGVVGRMPRSGAHTARSGMTGGDI